MGKQNGKIELGSNLPTPDGFDNDLLKVVTISTPDECIDMRQDIYKFLVSGDNTIENLRDMWKLQKTQDIDEDRAKSLVNDWVDYKTNITRVYGECFANSKDALEYREISSDEGRANLFKEEFNKLFKNNDGSMTLDLRAVEDLDTFAGAARSRCKGMLNADVTMNSIETYVDDNYHQRTVAITVPYASVKAAKRACKQSIYASKYFWEDHTQCGYVDAVEKDGFVGKIESDDNGNTLDAHYYSLSDNGKKVDMSLSDVYDRDDYNKYVQVRNSHANDRVRTVNEAFSDMSHYDENTVSLDGASLV